MLISRADYARRRGISQTAIHKAIKSGRITPIDGRIDPEVADIQWEKNRRRAPSLWNAPKHQPDPLEALTVADSAIWRAWHDDRSALEAAVKAWTALVVESPTAQARLSDELTDLLRFMAECRDELQAENRDE